MPTNIDISVVVWSSLLQCPAKPTDCTPPLPQDTPPLNTSTSPTALSLLENKRSTEYKMPAVECRLLECTVHLSTPCALFLEGESKRHQCVPPSPAPYKYCTVQEYLTLLDTPTARRPGNDSFFPQSLKDDMTGLLRTAASAQRDSETPSDASLPITRCHGQSKSILGHGTDTAWVHSRSSCCSVPCQSTSVLQLFIAHPLPGLDLSTCVFPPAPTNNLASPQAPKL
jgi:hypothetical protein